MTSIFSRLLNWRRLKADPTIPPPAQLWLDLPDAPARIEIMKKSGQITDKEAEQLLFFREQGYFIFPKAIPADVVDTIREELLTIHLEGEKYLVRVPPAKKGHKATVHPDKPVLSPKSRLLDYYVHSELTRDMALAPVLTRFLSLLYDEPPLLFQSLLFTWGTEHSIHADNTYIVSDPPCTLIAAWFALEDVKEGSGELAYYPGSHLDPLYTFNKNNIAWVPDRDGLGVHKKYTDYLLDQAVKNNREPKYFFAKKGDVMLWHANFIHYGTAVTQTDKTRYSLLTHYCPSQRARPNYFKFFKEAYKRTWKDAFYSSRRYDLRPDVNNPYPVYKG